MTHHFLSSSFIISAALLPALGSAEDAGNRLSFDDPDPVVEDQTSAGQTDSTGSTPESVSGESTTVTNEQAVGVSDQGDAMDFTPQSQRKRRSRQPEWKPIITVRSGLGFNTNVPVLPDDADPSDGSKRESMVVDTLATVGSKWRGSGPHRFRLSGIGSSTIFTEALDYNTDRLVFWPVISTSPRA